MCWTMVSQLANCVGARVSGLACMTHGCLDMQTVLGKGVCTAKMSKARAPGLTECARQVCLDLQNGAGQGSGLSKSVED